MPKKPDVAREDRFPVASRRELHDIADELGLDRDARESKALLFMRILDRASALWKFAQAAEQSDPDRKEWPWSE